MSLTLYVILWAALALVVVGMAIYRNILGIHEPALHVARGAETVQEAKEFNREENIERWGQRLTVIVIVYGLVLASAYLFIVSEHGLRMLR
jgi:hypothetical protein